MAFSVEDERNQVSFELGLCEAELYKLKEKYEEKLEEYEMLKAEERDLEKQCEKLTSSDAS